MLAKQPDRKGDPMQIPSPNPAMTTKDVIEALRASGKPVSEWGRAIDGTPMLAARTGGDKQPPIFITAGVHAIETAGVHAALNLLHMLDTEHEVHILPLRDPLGFAGVNHCLSFAAGKPVDVPDTDAALNYLLSHGQLIWREGEMVVVKLGNVGFAWHPLRPGLESYWEIFTRIGKAARDEPALLRPLWSCSVMMVNSVSGVEGSGAMERCWHALLTGQAEWLHLNRLFGRDDAPLEVVAVERLMQAVRPGLICDLHEGNGEGFWMPIPKPSENAERVYEMTRAYFDYIHSRGYPITTYENWLATDRTGAPDPNWMSPEPRLPGLFWCTSLLRGEGPNLMDHARLYGIGYGTEAPMQRPLAMRVDGITNGILAAIRVWEETIE